jgi:hypothetical protein
MKIQSICSILLAVWVVKYSVIVNRNVVPCVGQQSVQVSTNVFQSPACVMTQATPVEDKFKTEEAANEYAVKMKALGAENVRVVKQK